MKKLNGLVFRVMMALVFLQVQAYRSAFAQQSSITRQNGEQLPSDIRPETGSRMPWAHREDFSSEEERQAFDRVIQLNPNANKLKGPLGVTGTQVHIPMVAEANLVSSDWLRNKSGLDQRYVELSILISTRESNNGWEWIQHEKRSKNIIPRETVEVVRNRKDTKGLEEKDGDYIVNFLFGIRGFLRDLVGPENANSRIQDTASFRWLPGTREILSNSRPGRFQNSTKEVNDIIPKKMLP